jgi:hypothetical protein
MYWLKKCIFSINPQYKMGICKTCRKIIDFNKLRSAEPRDGHYNWKGPQELINQSCLENNKSFITYKKYLDTKDTNC